MATSEAADPAAWHRSVAGVFGDRVAGTTDWQAPTPVAGWVALDVVRHLTGWLPGFLTAGTGIVLPKGPAVDDDPVGAWQCQATAVQALLEADETATRTYASAMLGDLPLAVAVSRFYTADVFMHTWDLARATGQDDTLDPETCALLLAGMEPMDGAMRASGQFGPRHPVAEGADIQSRLLAFIGRDPQWSPPALPPPALPPPA